jgi:hypothetical protein
MVNMLLVEVIWFADGFRIVLPIGPKWVRASLPFFPEERDRFFLRNDVLIHILKRAVEKIENLWFQIPFSSLLPAANVDPTMADYWGNSMENINRVCECQVHRAETTFFNFVNNALKYKAFSWSVYDAQHLAKKSRFSAHYVKKYQKNWFKIL